MGYNRFSILLTIRLVLIMVAITFLGFIVSTPGYHAATLLGGIVVVGLGWEIFRFVSKTNQELSRFLDAARYADFGQRFDLGPVGAGFGRLGETFSDILDRFRESRTQQESDLRHIKALVEHVPVPLISVYADNRVQLWNNAARRLFGLAAVVRQDDLRQFGETFYDLVTSLRAGDRKLVSFNTDNMEQTLTVAATEIVVEGKIERLISLQNIQSELDDTQLDAWQDLVRVLTHEILNSITPVASLAKTAADLAEEAARDAESKQVKVEALDDVRDALATVARRSDGLTNFVSSYRQLTRLPEPEKSRFQVQSLFHDVENLFGEGRAGLNLDTAVQPPGLEVSADREMLEQVLLNIVQNADHALADRSEGHVHFSASLNNRGHVIIEISDNGPGIPEDQFRKIFVPFFTTKQEGTGVGLALSRQIMVAHGGSIRVRNADSGGACFTLVF